MIQIVRNIQRGPMKTDPAQKDPAHGDPDNRIFVPQFQDETTCVFYKTLKYKQIDKDIHNNKKNTQDSTVFPGLMKYLFEGKQFLFHRICLFIINY